MYVYIDIYMCIYVYMYMYVYNLSPCCCGSHCIRTVAPTMNTATIPLFTEPLSPIP